MPTRWNSDLACLAAHVRFETPVKQLTSSDGLSEYALSEAQWKLAKQLCEVLVVRGYRLLCPPRILPERIQVFEDITKLFSRAEVPLVYEVIPILEELEATLTNIRNDATLPNVICIAAMAALIVVGKYYALTDDCEVYRIAISKSDIILVRVANSILAVMCPDKKMEWFKTIRVGVLRTVPRLIVLFGSAGMTPTHLGIHQRQRRPRQLQGPPRPRYSVVREY